MTSAFENLSGANKPLRAEPPDKREFEGLIRSGHARLCDRLEQFNSAMLVTSGTYFVFYLSSETSTVLPVLSRFTIS